MNYGAEQSFREREQRVIAFIFRAASLCLWSSCFPLCSSRSIHYAEEQGICYVPLESSNIWASNQSMPLGRRSRRVRRYGTADFQPPRPGGMPRENGALDD